MAEPLIIEVRANEWVLRDRNPHVPYSPEEIAADASACRDSGASIFHFHVRDPRSGAPSPDPALYANVMRLIRGARSARELILMPTNFPSSKAWSAEPDLDRIAPIMDIARHPETRPELAPIDMVTCNIDTFVEDENAFKTVDRIYPNTTATCQAFARSYTSAGLTPVPFLWNATSVAFTQCFVKIRLFEELRWCELVLRYDGLWAHPATKAGLEAYLVFVEPLGWRWSVVANGSNMFEQIAEEAIQRGGHISIGLGDYHYDELNSPTNAELVKRVVALAGKLGRAVATPSEARAMLRLTCAA